MSRIGYPRVSSAEQCLDIQLAKLKSERCVIIRSEKVSGASRNGRTELATVLEFLRPGDELVVTRLDRLGRDTRDVLNLIHDCEQRGAFMTVLDPHVSTREETGHVILNKERQREGIEKAKKEGIYKGGKRPSLMFFSMKESVHVEASQKAAAGIKLAPFALEVFKAALQVGIILFVQAPPHVERQAPSPPGHLQQVTIDRAGWPP